MSRAGLTRYAWLSIAAALATIALKTIAWRVTGSVGLFSDAMESLVNLAGAVVALAMLTVAARPPDEDHTFGHDKAEYFSEGFEGALVLVAAAGIAFAAVRRLLAPAPIEQTGLGLAVSAAASVVNFAVARVLLAAGRRAGSPALVADARHLLTDVWTSAGVLLGVGLVAATGWTVLDPLVALAVAVNILVTGFSLVRTAVLGLMDAAIPEDERRAVEGALAFLAERGAAYHGLRTRRAGARRFVSLHVLVPGSWSVADGHRFAHETEARIGAALEGSDVEVHVEPAEEATSCGYGKAGDASTRRSEPSVRASS